MAYLLCQAVNRTVEIKDDVLIVAGEWITRLLGREIISISNPHARIEDTEKGYRLTALNGRTVYSGQLVKPGEKVYLEHYGVVQFGDPKDGVIFIFNDIEQQQMWDDAQVVQQAEIDIEKVKTASEKLSQELFRKSPRTLRPFIRHLLEFIMEKFKCHRGVLYRVEGSKWKPLIAKAPKSFNPPDKIIRSVWETKKPQRFSLDEVVDEEEDLSRSIVEDQVCSAICFPLTRDKDRIIGVLYVDVIESVVRLGTRELAVLCSLLPAVSAILDILLEAEKEKIRAKSLLQSFCRQNATDRMKVVVVNPSMHTFGFAKAILDGDIFVYCTLVFKPGVRSDFSTLVAACAVIASTVEFTCRSISSDNSEEVFVQVGEVCRERFSELNISIAVATVTFQKLLTFAAYGEVRLIVKPKARNAFYNVSNLTHLNNAMGQSVLEECFELQDNTFFYLTGEDEEEMCSVFDSSGSFEAAKVLLESREKGGLLSKLNEGGDGDGWKEIKL